MSNPEYRFALHGGAGARRGRDYAEAEAHMRDVAETAGRRLADSEHALDVVEFAVAELERSGLYVAGRGSAPNSAGYVELDASIMDGATQKAGAVAALRDFVNPISIARGIMQQTPHVMLAGNGAAAFAMQHGFDAVVDPDTWYRVPVGVEGQEVRQGTHGTVGAVACDCRGQLASATSTGGTFGKLEGRVGDTPLIGAGTWADRNVAVSCTGTGEFFIRTGAALSVACLLRAGVALELDVEDEVWAPADARAVRPIWQNLGSHAITYSAAGDKVTLVGGTW